MTVARLRSHSCLPRPNLVPERARQRAVCWWLSQMLANLPTKHAAERETVNNPATRMRTAGHQFLIFNFSTAFFFPVRGRHAHVLSSDPTRCTILKRTYSLRAMTIAMAAENAALTLMIVSTAELCWLRSRPLRSGIKRLGTLLDELAISRATSTARG